VVARLVSVASAAPDAACDHVAVAA